MKPKSRFSCDSSSRTKSMQRDASKMTKSMAYIGVLAVVVGVLLTTCVGSAWSMELLRDEEMASIRGTACPNSICEDTGRCYTGPLCIGAPPNDCGLISGIQWHADCVEGAFECEERETRNDCFEIAECELCWEEGGTKYCAECFGVHDSGERRRCETIE